MREILVDTSIWIDYFRSGKNSIKLDYLISENLIVTNAIILAELLPLLMIRKEQQVITILKKIKANPIKINWQEIMDFQVACLQSGSSGNGIPDLLIAQNAMQNNNPIYSIDKHFAYKLQAKIDIELFT